MNPKEDAKGFYFLDQKPDDNKIGKERLLPIPNHDFEDGTFFYDYIYSWLFEYRQVLAKPETKTFFVRPKEGDSYCQTNVEGDEGASMFFHKIENIFKRVYKISMGPHIIRTIYTTDMKNKGVSEAKRIAACEYLNHSPEMNDKVYNQQSSLERARPYIEELFKSENPFKVKED